MSELSLDLLKIFYEVAKEESITRAGENLYISQPAVSQSIKKLEDELGGVLFNRSNKGIKLTEEGRSFFEYVKGALELVEKGRDEFANFKTLKKGTVKIGISTSLTKLVLLDAIINFHKDYPDVKIELINGLTSNILNDLQEGKIDLAIYSEDINNSKLETIPLKTCNHTFVYNKDFFKLCEPISLKEICSYPLILQNRQSNTRKLFDKLTDNYDIGEYNCTEVVSQELVKILAECGLGFGFTVAETVQSDKLSFVNLKEKLPPVQVKLAYSSLFNPTFACKKLIEYIK